MFSSSPIQLWQQLHTQCLWARRGLDDLLAKIVIVGGISSAENERVRQRLKKLDGELDKIVSLANDARPIYERCEQLECAARYFAATSDTLIQSVSAALAPFIDDTAYEHQQAIINGTLSE